MMKFVFVFIACIIISDVKCFLNFLNPNQWDPSLQVETNDGTVQGIIRYTSRHNVSYYSFQGIPFALPPIKELRFKDPVPSKSWSNQGILDGTKGRRSCINDPLLALAIEKIVRKSSEDCLYLNIYAPKIKRTSLPVLLWIYGGVFEIGSSDFEEYAPDFFIEEEVIIVTFNYRVGMFGFLSTGDLECPGNMGLKDQHLAIKWIKNNIKNFGGDPDRITIQGQSAGAVSVSYQLLSPLNRGLVSAAIMHSGSVLSSWALQPQPQFIALKTALFLGIPYVASGREASRFFIKQMQKMDGKFLRKSGVFLFLLVASINAGTSFPYAPVIEPDHPGALVTKQSYEALERGDFLTVPTIAGVTSKEVGFFYQQLHQFVEPILFLLDLFPELQFRNFPVRSDMARREAGRLIRKKYFKHRTYADATRDELVSLLSDEFFVRPAIKFTQLSSRYTPTYFYEWAYKGDLGLKALRGESRQIDGVFHTEDIGYFFRKSYEKIDAPEDQIVRDRAVRLWANFVKFQNPTPSRDPFLENVIWHPNTNSTGVKCLRIDSNLTYLDTFTDFDYEFWDSVVANYAQRPFFTYR